MGLVLVIVTRIRNTHSCMQKNMKAHSAKEPWAVEIRDTIFVGV
jgi:hypothetical protein